MFRVIVHNVSLLRFRSLDFIHTFISWETVAVRRLLDAPKRVSPWTDVSSDQMIWGSFRSGVPSTFSTDILQTLLLKGCRLSSPVLLLQVLRRRCPLVALSEEE